MTTTVILTAMRPIHFKSVVVSPCSRYFLLTQNMIGPIINVGIVITLCTTCWTQSIAQLDMLATESVLKFKERWLSVPKPYINVMLPTEIEFKVKDVEKLAIKIVRGLGRTPFLTFNFNISQFPDNKLFQNELFWFPFHVTSYDVDLHCSKTLLEKTIRKNRSYFSLVRGKK